MSKKSNKLYKEVKKATIIALNKMKDQEDESAARAASQDGPNESYHLKAAKKAKEKIDHYIALLKDVSCESTETLIIAKIIEIAIEKGEEDN